MRERKRKKRKFNAWTSILQGSYNDNDNIKHNPTSYYFFWCLLAVFAPVAALTKSQIQSSELSLLVEKRNKKAFLFIFIAFFYLAFFIFSGMAERLL